MSEIQISVKARKDRAKQVQIEECFRQRNEQILKEQESHTFSYMQWWEAWKCGWLCAHALTLYSFPSPFLHRKKLFRFSKEPYFLSWREEAKAKHKVWLEERRRENANRR